MLEREICRDERGKSNHGFEPSPLAQEHPSGLPSTVKPQNCRVERKFGVICYMCDDCTFSVLWRRKSLAAINEQQKRNCTFAACGGYIKLYVACIGIFASFEWNACDTGSAPWSIWTNRDHR
jgi:hypothetical protein